MTALRVQKRTLRVIPHLPNGGADTGQPWIGGLFLHCDDRMKSFKDGRCA
jgi:hypothetical protein